MKAIPVQLVRAFGKPDSPKAFQRRNRQSRTYFCESSRLSSSFCPRSLGSSLGGNIDLCRNLQLTSSFRKLSKCRGGTRAVSSLLPVFPKELALKKLTQRTLSILGTYPLHLQCGVAAAFVAFALLGLAPATQFIRRNFFQRKDWDKSRTKHIVTSYIRPLILWAGVLVMCRGLDPVVLRSERSQAVKDRFVMFLRSLSTVLTFAFCTARMTQQLQRVMMDRHKNEDSRNLGIRFIGSAVSTSVWVAAVCLFMELLGFSTQKWLTAGGFGTVLLTLAGREIFTNFLSSVMIHATRPFVEFEWIQTKIDGQEVSGTVEHVGWWSPTVIRGEDREAVHIPNHKFTMSVVRNLSQKTHWRIKTYIGLSHLDSNKINLIVADMRKVLSKHPQVEHRRLHRRVFFDNIDPVNQSLMIMVSCFVKTSHYEEYLSVKEIILLNLLKVISHHNARLATPIRSVQRLYDEAETRQSPFRNMSNEDGLGRPLLLVEASAVAAENGNGSVRSSSNNLQHEASVTPSADGVKAKHSENDSGRSSSNNLQQESVTPSKAKHSEIDSETAVPKEKSLEGLESMGLNAKDISLLGAAFVKPPAVISEAEPQSLETRNETTQEEADFSKLASKDAKVKIKEAAVQELEAVKEAVQELKKTSTKAAAEGNKVVKEIVQEVKKSGGKAAAEASKLVKEAVQELKKSSTGKASAEASKVKGKESSGKLKNLTDADEKAVGNEAVQLKQSDDPWKDSPAEEGGKVKKGVSLEENLVLGVALAGSKRTLPLNDGFCDEKETSTKNSKKTELPSKKNG